MRSFLILCATLVCINVTAQTTSPKPPVIRQGFVFGAAIGFSSLHLSTPGLADQSVATTSFPNFKIGYMLNPHTALVLCLPGSIYTYKGEGRQRQRGFEGMIPSIQYWLKERWWVLGGVCLALDAPAFYDIKDETERKFYFGFGALAGTGYELWHRKNQSLDLQLRVHYGQPKVLQGVEKGLAFNILIGYNWY